MANNNKYNGPRIYKPFEKKNERIGRPVEDELEDLIDEEDLSEYGDSLFDEEKDTRTDHYGAVQTDRKLFSFGNVWFIVMAVLTAIVFIGIGVGLYFWIFGSKNCQGKERPDNVPTASASVTAEPQEVSPSPVETETPSDEPSVPVLYPFPKEGVTEYRIREEIVSRTGYAYTLSDVKHSVDETDLSDEVSLTLLEDRGDDTYHSDFIMRFVFDPETNVWNLVYLDQTTPQSETELNPPETFTFGGAEIESGATSIVGSELGINGGGSTYRFIPKSEVEMLVKLCPDLRKLQLNHCWLESYEPLSKLKNLTVLDLTECGSKSGKGEQLTDISWISPLRDLVELRLNGNAIEDVTPLASLQNLTLLNLSDNAIDDTAMDTIAMLSKLQYLNLYINKISDLEALTELNNVTYLNIHRTNLTGIDFLKNMPSLTMLYIGEDYEGNPLPEFDWYNVLKKLPNLKRVNVRENDAYVVEQLERLVKEGYFTDLRKYK